MTDAGRIVGVLGGMGPEASVDFMAKVVAATPANKDQDHVRMLVDHNPKVPNRQDAILHDGDDPSHALALMAQGLQEAGADFLVVPCNTAYVFANAITSATTLPLISIIDVTVDAIATKCPGASSIGVLATAGCLQAGVYQEGLLANGYEPLLPTDSELEELMRLLNGIKGGILNEATRAGICRLAETLQERGAEAIIAGCTEIPLALDASMLSVPLLSSTDLLAERTVQLARGERPFPDEV